MAIKIFYSFDDILLAPLELIFLTSGLPLKYRLLAPLAVAEIDLFTVSFASLAPESWAMRLPTVNS